MQVALSQIGATLCPECKHMLYLASDGQRMVSTYVHILLSMCIVKALHHKGFPPCGAI